MPLGLLCSMALVSWQAAVEGVEEGASGMTANFSASAACFGFDIQLEMGTCGHDTSCQFG